MYFYNREEIASFSLGMGAVMVWAKMNAGKKLEQV